MTQSASPDPARIVTVLLVDDEPPARRGLRELLAPHHDLHIVGEAGSGADAVDAIRTLTPDLVFLDIQMPDGNGFDVIRQIGVDRMPATIFSTAYDQHALAAFEAHALDYLLKPYDEKRVNVTVARARTHLRRASTDARLVRLLARAEEHARYAQRLVVRNGAQTHFVPVASIDYVEAQENYVRLHFGDRSMLMRESLTGLAAQLDPARFIRVHRGLIVQTARVVAAQSLPAGEYVLKLASGRSIKSGRTYRAWVQTALAIKP